jgi:polysaccharide deacetylase family protein (PEP-CTERM system associated)
MKEMPPKYCIFTFDIEEWFQVENLKESISKEDWNHKKSSVEQNTNKILSILSKYNIPATFFVLGWIAEKYPDLVRKIVSKGHEIACHGFGHDLIYKLKEKQIYDDILKSKKLLEDISGQEIIGYRAPSFSVNDILIEVLKRQDFKYDSSYSPFSLNKRYGKINRTMVKINNHFKFDNDLEEIPLSMLKIFNFDLPIAGGAYFRLLPYWLFRYFVKRKINRDRFYVFYLHPWEFEPDQPRIKNIRLNHRIRHYTGLKHTEQKMERLIQYLKDFNCKFLTMRDYVNEIEG